MASLTQWTWVCIGSGSLRWTGKPGVLQSMGLQRVRHHWATELTDCPIQKSLFQVKLPQNMFDKLKRISYWHAFHLQFHLETSEKPLQGTHVRWATVWRLSLVTHMCAQSLSQVQIFVIPWTTDQAPLSMGFSWQEYWSRLPFPTPEASSRPRDGACISCVSCIGRWVLYHCTSWI